MVLNNVTKFQKILIKSIRFRERTSLGQTYIRKYVQKYIRKYVGTDGGNTKCPGHYHGGGIKTRKNVVQAVFWPSGLDPP